MVTHIREPAYLSCLLEIKCLISQNTNSTDGVDFPDQGNYLSSCKIPRQPKEGVDQEKGKGNQSRDWTQDLNKKIDSSSK